MRAASNRLQSFLEDFVKSFLGVTVIFLLSLVALSASVHRSAFRSEQMATKPGTSQTPVVVELFTSEGCSSCPPADAILARLASLQNVPGAEVIALEEHVDYWDHLGWTDPFSSREYTIRQEAYGQSFDTGSVYTPQMIVDGYTEFIGSREPQVRQAIAKAAARMKTRVTLAFTAQGDAHADVTVHVDKLSGATPGDAVEVFMAITESKLHSAVTRGENAGEDLHHSPVVRTLKKIGVARGAEETSFSATPDLKIESNWKRENLQAIVFVQERKSRRILGAAAIPLS